MTPRQMVKAWDAGKPVWTVEMGGLGPGYEQAIQILVLELLRDAEPIPKPTGESYDLRGWGEAAVTRCNDLAGGFSGAQVGAAKGLALRFFVHGIDATIQAVGEDRRIMVSRRWPRAPEVKP